MKTPRDLDTSGSINIAATADIHYGTDSAGELSETFAEVAERADVFLIAGDLTSHGRADEAAVLAEDLREVTVPIVTVLGNHDYHCDENEKIAALMQEAGVVVLDGTAITLEVGGRTLGVAGTKGFGGGFASASGTDFGEPEMKAFIRHTANTAGALGTALGEIVETEHKVALLHYSPVEQTLQGERLEIYPFLGSYLLAEAIDATPPDLVLHGHAHSGSEKGMTPGGVPVRNVSLPVIRRPYALFPLREEV
jgi:Icc-related predicted phosphoesterase